MKRSNWIAIAAFAAVALGASALVTLGKSGRQEAAPPAAPTASVVRTAKPQPSAQSASLRLPAIAEPYASVLVYARINGFLAEQRADLGDRVKRGQVLAVIDAPEVEREYDRARAALAQAEARLELSRRNLERTETLVAQKFLSEAALDERRADAQVADADRRAAQAEIARLAELLKFRTVRAPFSGLVTERNANPGDLVAGDQRQSGGYLYRISQLDPLRVAIDVPQSALANIRVGSQLTIEFAELAGERFKGRVTRTAGLIDGRSGTMRIEASLANTDGRIPGGLAGHVVIEPGAGSTGWSVPVNAVVLRDGNAHVAIVAENRLRYLPVQVGRNFGQTVEIRQGLTGDEAIVLNPNALLRDGDAVQVAPPQTAGK
jgi:RND family efflux transporter MFP subunit